MIDEKQLPVGAVLAVIVVLGFFALLFLLSRNPAVNHDALNVLYGSLGASVTGVMGYYFGSSAGSRAKTEMLQGNREQGTGNSAPSPEPRAPIAGGGAAA
jgi:hypothetical protein